MKKSIYLLLLVVTAIFVSCKEEPSKFVEQLFTNKQISDAIEQCINVVVDSTANSLCMVDTIHRKYGYYYYADSTYRLTLLPIAKTVVDTLTKYGYEAQINMLFFYMNRAAEQCKNEVTQFWKEGIKEMVYLNPNQLLHGENSAITDYVKATKQSEFVSTLTSSILKKQFDALNVVAKWNALQEIYFEKTGNYSSIDVLAISSQQMAIGFFKHMAIVEDAIREYPNLRGDKNGWLYKVFATL